MHVLLDSFYLFVFLVLLIGACRNSDQINASISPLINQLEKQNQINLSEIFRDEFPGEKIELVQRQAGGFSAQIYAVDSDKRQYILRSIANRSKEAIFKDIYFSQLMYENGVSPKPYYVSYSKGIIILDKIPNVTIYDAIETIDNLPILLAEKLRVVHTIVPQGKYETKSIKDVIASQLNGHQVTEKFESLIDFIKNCMPILLDEIENNKAKRTTLVHMDLSPFNILFDGSRIWLIDWETAGYNDPFYDVATIMSLMLLRPQHRKVFLNKYFGRDPTFGELRDIEVNMAYCLICYGAFCLDLARYDLANNNLSVPMTAKYSFAEIMDGAANLKSSQAQLRLAVILLKEAKRILKSLHY